MAFFGAVALPRHVWGKTLPAPNAFEKTLRRRRGDFYVECAALLTNTPRANKIGVGLVREAGSALASGDVHGARLLSSISSIKTERIFLMFFNCLSESSRVSDDLMVI
jgi:hypothetical protein